MRSILWTVLVLLHSVARAADVKLSVHSRRNYTGHWVIKTDLVSKNRQEAGHPSGLSMDMSHCADSDTVHLVMTLMVLSTPPEGYELFPGLGQYRLHTASRSWTDAREACIQEGAHLLLLNSDAEVDIVREFYARNPNIQNPTYSAEKLLFVGIHDRFSENQWTTVQGAPLASTGYSKWRPGDPNGGLAENCIVVDKVGNYLDVPCPWKLGFICELLPL